MDVIRLNSGTDPVYRLFREYAEGECVYRRLERAEFEERFFAPLEGYEKVFLCAENAGAAASRIPISAYSSATVSTITAKRPSPIREK